MLNLRRFALLPFLALALTACGETPVDPAGPPAEADLSRANADLVSVVDAARDLNATTGEFTTFLAAVDAAGIEEDLSGDGQRTILAPTDRAFDRLNLNPGNVEDVVGAELLREILLHPVVSGRRNATSLGAQSTIHTVGGATLEATRTDEGVMVEDARITVPDVTARHGLVQGVDRILVPEGVIIPPVQVDPPYWGTIFISSEIMTADDPTAFEGLTPAPRGFGWMFDRRINNWVWIESIRFDATFSDGLTAQIQVNPEFDEAKALEEAEKCAREIGRLPTELRKDMETVWIHMGTEAFGGGNNNILIHTGQAALYEADGILHETLMHEAVHTSLDAQHATSAGWLAAQAADGNFISAYARDFPVQEDLAETFVPWFAVRFARDRISEEMYDTIMATIPHRIAYLDAQGFDMYPVVD
jgi:uncharacterized surface protein with fasciclin (FAS1) repeats